MLLSPPVGLGACACKARVDPEAASVVRGPNTVLDVLAGSEGRGRPWLSDREYGLATTARRQLIPLAWAARHSCSASSTKRQSALASRICSIVRQSALSSRG